MNREKTIKYISETSVDEMEKQMLAKNSDLDHVIAAAKEARKIFGLKVEELISRLSSHLPEFRVGMLLEAKEDCLNNFRKGQRASVDDINDGSALLDGLAYISLENVRRYFVVLK